MIPQLLTLAALALPHVPDGKAEWGRFRGPDGTGRSAATGLPEALDPETNLVWRTEIPKGYSSPVVAGDLVIVTGADEEGSAAFGLDAFTGEVLWRAAAPGEKGEHYGGPNARESATPATDGERVVCCFRDFGLVCYDLEGEELWQHPLGHLYVPHGASSSPVLCDGTVLMQCDHDRGSYLLALELATGKQRWRAERPGMTHSYSSPAIHRPADGPPVAVLSGSFQASAYSVADGKRLWWAEGMCWMPEALPTVADGLAFVSSYIPPATEFGGPRLPETFAELLEEHDADEDGRIVREEWQDPGMQQLWFILDYDGDDAFTQADFDLTTRRYASDGGFFAIELGGEGDVTGSKVRWKIDDRRSMPGPASPLVAGGVLYLMKDGGVFTSLDPQTGEEHKRARVGSPDSYFASPVFGDGKIYLAGTSGVVTVVRAGAEWEELASHGLNEPIWATPALMDGRVVVRTDEALYAFESRDGE